YITKDLMSKSYETYNSPIDAATYFGNKINSKSFILSKEFGAAISELKLFNEDGSDYVPSADDVNSGNVYLLGGIKRGTEDGISFSAITISEFGEIITDDNGEIQRNEWGGALRYKSQYF